MNVESLEERRSEGSPLPPTRADFPGWVRRARERAPVLQADNVDLLFRLRGGGTGGEGPRGGDGRIGWVRVGGGGDGVEGERQERASMGNKTRRKGRKSSMALGGGAWFSCRGGGVGGTSPGGGDGSVSPPAGGETAAAAATAVRDNAFLEFVAPGKVEVRHEELDEERVVGEGQVLVKAICSSISSGTELKVRGGMA